MWGHDNLKEIIIYIFIHLRVQIFVKCQTFQLFAIVSGNTSAYAGALFLFCFFSIFNFKDQNNCGLFGQNDSENFPTYNSMIITANFDIIAPYGAKIQ